MVKKISLRWRLTLLTSLLIAICCIGLSLVLNISAYRMADGIDAAVIQPAFSAESTIPSDPAIPLVPSESSETVQAAKHSYLLESLLYTILAVLTGGVLTYYIAGKALEPVRALSSQVRNINMNNLDEAIEVPQTKDELAELTISFNEMTDKLAQAFAVQKRFSADAAHELRTPLAVLQTKLDVFEKKKVHTDADYAALTEAFKKQVSRLRVLVTELLDIANMEHEVQRQDIGLKELLNDIVKDLSVVARDKDVSITIDGGGYHISGEREMLYRAFYNLIENAIKYNVSGGSVNIEITEQDKDSVTVAIKDTGIGIPNELKTQIFTPFYRVDKSRSRKMGGSGLGLALVYGIVKKHSGVIAVSDNPDAGSCFTITLPKE